MQILSAAARRSQEGGGALSVAHGTAPCHRHSPATLALRGCVPLPCHRAFVRPALTIFMLVPGASGAAGLARLPEFSLPGPRTRLGPLPSDGGHAPSAQDDVPTSRAPPGPGAVPSPGPWTRCCPFRAQMRSPAERVHSRPPDDSRRPGCGVHKACASAPVTPATPVTAGQRKPCLAQSSRQEDDVEVAPCPQRSLRHFHPAKLQRALAVRWAP